MPEWLPYLIVTVIVILAGALAWFIKIAWPVLRKLSHFVDDVLGEPDRPVFPEDLDSWCVLLTSSTR